MKGYLSGPRVRRPISLLAVGLLASVPLAVFGVERALEFKPGFNLLSPAEDVQVGRENAAQVEKQLPILHDPEVDRYLGELGRRLAAYSPNNRSEYVWLFKVVNSRDINAFALPGGYIYVNRGAIEAAQNEAQLAGVMAHEEGHVVMRHGTHQASEMMLAQAPLAILGGALGQGGSWLSRLAQYGIGWREIGISAQFARHRGASRPGGRLHPLPGGLRSPCHGAVLPDHRAKISRPYDGVFLGPPEPRAPY